MIYFTLALPFMIMPLAGLAIEGNVARIVQAKLQAAVDGASLGAGRLLGTDANLQEIAGEFLQANFQTTGSGFFGANNLTYNAVYTPGVVQTVAVTASVQVPATLGRLLGATNYTVSATATASRKETRLIMIIDRSGSMGSLQSTIQSLAEGFAQKFNGSSTTSGADELGLVVFDGSALVAYPTAWPWDPTITATSTGGPDSLFNNGSSTDMINQIAATHWGGFTNTSAALSLAYHELQKAHLRDLALPGSGGLDQRLNAVLFFTDGMPTAAAIYPNNPADNVIKTTSACTYKAPSAPVPASEQMMGWIGAAANGSSGGSPFSSGSVTLFDVASLDSSQTLNYWLTLNGGTSEKDQIKPSNSSTAEGGCASLPATLSDMNTIPTIDAYGNATNTTGYVTGSDIIGGSYSSIYNGTAWSGADPTNGYQWGLTIWNAADNAAYNMRTDANQANRTGDTQSMPVTIHVIVYTGSGGYDEGLLKRFANTPDSTSFSQAQPQGLYVPAGNATDLANAFNQVASSLLHLSR
jgi:hypothetical protein